MSGLRVAIVHYHLRPGGVTSVIRRAACVLKQAGCSCAVLTGEPSSSVFPEHAHVSLIEGLGYGSHDCAQGHPDQMAKALILQAHAALGGPPDIWHFHNHSLGKNPALTAAVGLLAAMGHRLLLQIHDFAEDGRPRDFQRLMDDLEAPTQAALGERLYPGRPGIHYAVLNRRDARFLLTAGMDERRLHVLPNSIELQQEAPASMTGPGVAPFFLYPTRGIRRKNLGEFLLWAAAHNDDAQFATTLSPLNPYERPAYENWKNLAAELGLPVMFEVGEIPGASFPALLNRARAVVNTSVAEGFGLAFLEPFAASRPVTGRNLPEITGDFAASGLDLDALYDRLEVPMAWIRAETLRDKVAGALRAQRLAYGLECSPTDADQALKSMRGNETIDFGRLDEELQSEIVRKVAQTPALARHMTPDALGKNLPLPGVIARNRSLVRVEYGPKRYAQRLMTIFRSVMDDSECVADKPFSEQCLIEQFSAPERLCLLRT